jgi:hypothetical protein
VPAVRYPEAEWLPLPENQSQPTIVPRIGILHSQAGVGSLRNFFGRSSNLESTFWIGTDGTVEQYGDMNRRMDANYKANPFAFSVETENHIEYVRRGAWDDDPWSVEQVAAITRLCAWAHKEWNIPNRLTPTWDGSGFGWHIQFGSPGWWTPVSKACPGRRRIEQFRRVVVPALAGDYNDGVAFTDADALKIIAGVEKIQADNHAATLAAIAQLRKDVNKDITNATNRAINTLGKGFDPDIVSTLPNKD